MDEGKDREAPVEAALADTLPQSPTHWLEPIYREHSRALLQTAFRITGNASDAEDVLQTVFERLVRRTDPPDLTSGALPYLRRAAANAALDLVQSRRVRSSTPLSEMSPQVATDPEPAPDRLHHSQEIKNRLRRALAALSRRHAEMFVLRYFEGLDNQTIAEQFGTSAGTVAVTLHRVRARLMEELRPYHGGNQ
jgi:RNA polymerase sigma-70 factor (ECF subfamily)